MYNIYTKKTNSLTSNPEYAIISVTLKLNESGKPLFCFVNIENIS